MMNKGFDYRRELAEQSDEDWLLGGKNSKPCIAEIPEEERVNYLPDGELQFGVEDFMDCATRAPLNILEAKFNYLVRNRLMSHENHEWLLLNGYIKDNKVTFSDRFVAINANTTRQGNSLKAPLEAIRKQGLIPKAMLPARGDMTWADYHNEDDITVAMIKLGYEFTRRFTINYDKIYTPTFNTYAHMIDAAGFAWPQPIEGVYPRIEATPNHAFMIEKPAFTIFDNYIDVVDGDWRKQLARDYDFMSYGYRVYISWEGKPVKKNWLNDLIYELWDLVKSLLHWV